MDRRALLKKAEASASTGGRGHRRQLIRKTLPWLIMLFAMGLATRAHLLSRVVPHDDAYITFRYIDNLFAGKGLVYNDGEHIFGVSSPLYLLWLCFLKLIAPSASLPILAVRCNVTFFLLSAVAVYTTVLRWGEEVLLAAAAAALFCVNEALLQYSLAGMESFMFAALTLWALYAVSCEWYTGAALLSGLSCLARPEGVLVAATCAVAWLVHSRRNVVRYVLALCLPVLFWLVFAQTYFGTVVPHSIIAKARPLYPLPRGAGLEQMVDQITAWTFDDRLWKLRAIKPALAGLGAGVAILAVVGSGVLRGLKAWTAAFLFALFIAFYSVTNARVVDWYLPVIYAVWFILLTVGSPLAATWLTKRWFSRPVGTHWMAGLRYVPLALVLACGTGDGVTRAFATTWILEASAVRLRVDGYERAARWMNDHFSQDVTVAAPEIGALGYYWNGRVLDACGLVSPEALPFLPVPADQRDSPIDGPISRDLVEQLRPQVVVTLYVFAKRSLLPSRWFHAAYELVHSEPLPTPIWDSPDVLVYRLRETPAAKALGLRIPPSLLQRADEVIE